MSTEPKKSPWQSNPLPISPPPQRKDAPQPERPGEPDLHIEEIEEKHIPKDRNIFDK